MRANGAQVARTNIEETDRQNIGKTDRHYVSQCLHSTLFLQEIQYERVTLDSKIQNWDLHHFYAQFVPSNIRFKTFRTGKHNKAEAALPLCTLCIQRVATGNTSKQSGGGVLIRQRSSVSAVEAAPEGNAARKR